MFYMNQLSHDNDGHNLNERLTYRNQGSNLLQLNKNDSTVDVKGMHYSKNQNINRAE